MTAEERRAEIAAKTLPRGELERRYPHVKEMQAAAVEAVRDLQRKRILDEHGRLIAPTELLVDMRPESETEC